MRGQKRRQEIINMLKTSPEPIPGNVLANNLNVSRQIIVQDIALLKAAGNNIFSTSRGYFLVNMVLKRRVFKVYHNNEQIMDELYTIVDAGGRVLDVFINHKVYGELRAELFLDSRKNVDDFVANLIGGKISPLKQLTNDYHFHTVEADSDTILDLIEQKLKEKNYLVEALPT